MRSRPGRRRRIADFWGETGSQVHGGRPPLLARCLAFSRRSARLAGSFPGKPSSRLSPNSSSSVPQTPEPACAQEGSGPGLQPRRCSGAEPEPGADIPVSGSRSPPHPAPATARGRVQRPEEAPPNAPQPGLLSRAPRPQPPPGALHANKYQKGRPLNSPLILFCITICPSAEYICIHCEMLSKIPPIINTFPFILEPQSLCNHFKNAEFHFLCVLATFYGRSTLLSPY